MSLSQVSAKPYTRSAAPTEPEGALQRAAERPAGAARARLAILGVNAWIVALLVPSLHLDVWRDGGGLDLGLLVSIAPLVVLAVALAVPHRGAARWGLLAGYPASIALALAVRGELAERDAHGTIGLVLAALSLLAFVAAAAHASSHQPGSAQRETPLERDPVAEPVARRWVRRALLAIAAAGALALTLVAPTLGGRRARVERWGEAADDATVLAAVVASTVACVAIGAIIGPALRAARPGSHPPAQRQRRLAASMLLAVAAGVGWLVLRHFDALGSGP
jgi:hypothetical protein